MSLTRPAPTVFPPSRMAKRIVFSIAMGVINSTSMEMLSPGMPISTPSGGLAEGVERVMPGDNISIEVELITPIAMEKTIRFAIREGGKTVGAGRVGDILD